ncbi:MAG: nickel pincer cofactor biosynthesis protein LarC [Magnetococcales bacterium]|nr:nickel pincer cofactor biosynthesis protein LarC [Magnetococcales bacterium]
MHMYLDCISGIAGDMFVAACLDLGLDQEALSNALSTLDLDPWQLEVSRQCRGGMQGTHVFFKVPEMDHDDHDHHHHRHLSDILSLIAQSRLPEPVKRDASSIFTLLAEAEGKVHGVAPARVHFHEVGALDAILDICGAAFAVWRLGVTEFSSSPPAVGSGTVRCAHGLMSVPVPAVAELFCRHRVPMQPETGAPVGELTTPTGAAILVHYCRRFGPCPLTIVDRIGLGLGTREIPGRSNGLRILVQDAASRGEAMGRDRVTLLTTHIDDMNPEWYGPLWDHLFAAGALDVTLSPVTMKKGRPGVRLECMAPVAAASTLARVILHHSTSLGVRVQPCDRWVLPRTAGTVMTPWGAIRVKDAGGVRKPEYDDLCRVANTMNWSLPETAARVAACMTVSAAEDPGTPAS